MLAAVVGALAIIVWWVFFSRAPWLERLGVIVLMIVGIAATRLVLHESITGGMMGLMFPIYGLTFMTMALVVALLGAGFCMAAAHGTLYAFFTLHLEAAGYRVTTIGVPWTLGVLAEIFVFLYLPQLFRRFALSTILIASFACAVIRFLALGWLAQALWVIVLAQLLHAASFGAFHAAAVTAVHRVFPEAAHARGQTLFSSVTYGAGGAVGALAAGGLWELGGGARLLLLGVVGLAPLLDHVLKRSGLWFPTPARNR